ncbi:MAG TPA: hypothetical protein VES65_05935, partial [Solirubrobacteraceae bacterium]|nr:hypothetical protein [Solirubrobacteraceae bacterium]
MEGREEDTMDGKTLIKRAIGPSGGALHGAQNRSGQRHERDGAGEPSETRRPTEALRARLIAATVEVVSDGGGPRLA